jgi:curved DNA-binding protein CbpA
VNFAPTRVPTTPGAAVELSDDDRLYKGEIERAHGEMAKQNHYEFMGLHPSNIDDNSVRQALMRLAREYHPDRVAGGALSQDARLRTQVESLFRRLNDANEAIGSADARSNYDRTLDALGEGGAGAGAAGKRQRRPMEANNAFRMAETFFKKKEMKQAEAHYRQAVAFDPDDPKLLTALAVCIWLNPDHDEAQRTADARKRLHQIVDEHRHAEAAYRLGLILRKSNDEAGAQRQFALANKLDPTHVDALREVRLTEMRHQKGRAEADKGLIGKLLKK